MRPNSLGASRMPIVSANSASARSGSKRGQNGKSEKSRVKYSGRMYVVCKTSAMPTMSWNSQNGDAR